MGKTQFSDRAGCPQLCGPAERPASATERSHGRQGQGEIVRISPQIGSLLYSRVVLNPQVAHSS